MSDEFNSKMAASFIITIVLIVGTITVTTAVYHYCKWRMLTEGGYSQQMVPGYAYPVWVKGEPKAEASP